ncbi:MAG: hypothetical protein PW734_07185 [Verrucomicrobium sp.]|nr:hypothetical protein [Verrucomicrobium sp.]
MSQGRHLLCSDPADLGETLLRLWQTWRPHHDAAAAPVTLVVPSRAHQAAWKRFLLERGAVLFNAHFVLPRDLRPLLAEPLLGEKPPLWGREELEFLLRRMAERIDFPLCQALARDAAPLLRALDELAAAGHSAGALLAGQPATHRRDLDALRRGWEDLAGHPVLASGLRALQDARLRASAQRQPRSVPGRLLVLGCGLRQAADFPLLEAALRAWEECAVLTLLAAPGQETTEQPWHDLVAAALPQAETALPGGVPEEGENPAPPAPRFFLAADREDAAQGLRRQVRAWLAAKPDARIGLVFPAVSPGLSRAIQLLREDGIPFHSDFETPLPLRFEQELLRDWLRLQQDGLWLENFLAFWRRASAVPAFQKRFGADDGRLERKLAEARRQTMSDDAAVLAAWLREREEGLPALHAFMAWWEREGRWPENAPLRQYLDRLGAQLDLLLREGLGKPVRRFLAQELDRLSRAWTAPLGRAAACEILESFAARPERTRDFSEWSPVRFLSPESARGLAWDHLFLAEVEEGAWPRIDLPANLLEDGLRERLNRQAQVPSPSGGEEMSYATGYAPLLTAAEHRRLTRETFTLLLESAGGGTALCAAARDELDGGREVSPSPFYRQAWEAARGPWPEKLHPSPGTEPAASAPMEDASLSALRAARAARTDAESPFGPFQFATDGKPHAHPLTAGAAEKTLQDPATAWFEALLKMRRREETADDDPWPLFRGFWLHRWMEQLVLALGGAWAALPERAEWPGLFAALEKEWRRSGEEVLRAHAAAQAPAPTWWKSEWPRLGAAARSLLVRLQAELPPEFTHLASEFALELEPAGGPLPELPWRGRADLIALDAPDPSQAARACIIDLKTGLLAADFDAGAAADPEKAAYFQLVVYAALLRAARPNLREISVLVLHAGSGKAAAPTPVDPADPAFADAWRVLEKAWKEGLFGQTLPVRDRFQKSSRLPLATLEIPEETLREKWNRTPGLPPRGD